MERPFRFLRASGGARDLDLAHLPRLAAEEVRLLWVSAFWDGALEGIAEYRGERCLYVVAEPDLITAPDEERRWVLYRLTAEQLRQEERWHALFVTHVGAHWDYTGAEPEGGDGERNPDRFYVPYRAEYRAPRRVRDQALGWFDRFMTRS
jgi:hypothetical protein